MTSDGAAGADTEVADAEERSRYELRIGGELCGFADYRRRAEVLTVLHTEVPPAAQGRGYAALLTRGLLEDVRRRNGTVVPRCSYTAAFLQRHPEYQDLRATPT